MSDIYLSGGTVLLLGAVAVASALGGAALALIGVWTWYMLRLARRIESRGQLYLSDVDNEQARKLKAAADAATGMEYMRQALRSLAPEMAREFTRDEPKVDMSRKVTKPLRPKE